MKKVLGKGLNALLPSLPQNNEPAVIEIDIGKIEPNPEQPRRNFDSEAISRLAESIASVGVVQPIIVVDEGAYYKIIAGERRWRAARAAGLSTIPAIVRDYSKERGVEVSLIENLQRQDLNPIEEANGYERLIVEYGYTQDRIAQTVGKSRPAIANSIRLLKLSNHIKDLLSGGTLSPGHARALLAIGSEERRDIIADDIVDRDLNVRQTEIIVGKETAASNVGKARGGSGTVGGAGDTGETGSSGGSGIAGEAGTAGVTGNAGETGISGGISNAGGTGSAEGTGYAGGIGKAGDAAAVRGAGVCGGEHGGRDSAGGGRGAGGGVRVSGGKIAGETDAFERDAALRRIEDELRSRFNTKVSLAPAGTGGKAGRIIIEYYGDDDLQRLLEQLGAVK